MKQNYKILKNGLFRINKKVLNALSNPNEKKENTFKRITRKNDICIINLVKENTFYYYFNIIELF